jgi:hypothetical protein
MFFWIVLFLSVGSELARAEEAVEVVEAEYHLPAIVDSAVLADRATELWARVYRPGADVEGPLPLLLFLHGNHATCGRGQAPRIDNACTYTQKGTCPDGFVVTPNHLGYGYLARELASKGYLVVSINANRGINCGSGQTGDLALNLARGRLILRHMQLLSQWNQEGGSTKYLPFDLSKSIDFGQVGLMGHSRGGEGARAAYFAYLEKGSQWTSRIKDPVKFQGIFEIAPTDGFTPKILDAYSIPWAVLLPACDGDLRALPGRYPYDRMVTTRNRWNTLDPKAIFFVWGANHNFFNTEWQVSDSSGCHGHDPLWRDGYYSEEQQHLASRAVVSFFSAHVGHTRERQYARLFDPKYPLPDDITSLTNVERSASETSDSVINLSFEEFDQRTGRNSSGEPNEAQNIVIKHQVPVPSHATQRKGSSVFWRRSGNDVFWQGNWTPAGVGRDVSQYETLQFDVVRSAQHDRDPEPTDFSIRLVDASGNLSQSLALSRYMTLIGPVHVLLQTVRIPLKDFGAFDLRKLRGVRLIFDRSDRGSIYLSNMRILQRHFALGSAAHIPRPNESIVDRFVVDGEEQIPQQKQGRILGVIKEIAPQSNTELCWIDVQSPHLAPRDALPVIHIADFDSGLSRRDDQGSVDRMQFQVDCDVQKLLEQGTEALVKFQGSTDQDTIKLTDY